MIFPGASSADQRSRQIRFPLHGEHVVMHHAGRFARDPRNDRHRENPQNRDDYGARRREGIAA